MSGRSATPTGRVGEDGSPDVFVNRDEPIPTIILDRSPSPTPSQRTRMGSNESDHSDAESTASRTTRSRKSGGGFRNRFSAFKNKAGLKDGLQDQLLEKLLAQVLPPEEDGSLPRERSGSGSGSTHASTERPNFTLPTMSNNFRRFNARIGVVFVFQARAIRLLSWRRPVHTLSFLAIYTFICLDPYLVPLVPLVGLLVGVLVPSFLARHPAAEFSLSSDQAVPYSPHGGPPLAPALTVKPVKELSHDFFRNMRDLQNCMEDFSQLHDAVVSLMVPRTNFSDESLSTALFVGLFAASLVLSIASHILPWRFIFLGLGWAAVLASHPVIQSRIQSAHTKHIAPQEEAARGIARTWVERDVILDGAPETREVEIFELQRLVTPYSDGCTSPHDFDPSLGEWEPWLFSDSPYDPLSAGRLVGDRPKGTRFFEDVMPPPGWTWSEKKWALDLWSREWVEERIITGVEIETEGERWVYDILDENTSANFSGDCNQQKVGLAEESLPATQTTDSSDAGKSGGGKGKGISMQPTWEEGEDSDRRRGEWRRRRWVRLVKRKNITTADSG